MIDLVRAGPAHLAVLHAVQEEAMEDAWSLPGLGRLIDSPGVAAVLASLHGEPGGMALWRGTPGDTGDGEIELLALGVRPALRRRGLARALLTWGLERLGAGTIFLEVARDNVAALSLYEGEGFRAIATRRSYYIRGNARIDAIVMRWRQTEAKQEPSKG